MDELKWGVFKVGDSWLVVGSDGVRQAFASKAQAVSAAEMLVAAQRAAGREVQLTVQDEVGRLITAPAGRD